MSTIAETPKSEETEKPTESPKVESKDKEGGEPSPAGSANLSAITSQLSESMPEVQEHAIEQERLTQESKLAQYSHLKDRDGNPFDPAVHKTNKEGEPTLSSKGMLIKKPGRKPGQGTAPPKANVSSIGGTPEAQNKIASADREAALLRQQARATGVVTANMLIQIGVVAGGDEWKPRTDESIGLDEKAYLEQAFSDYFEATGKTDIPPGMALSVAVGAYALPRFSMPKTQQRTSRVWGKVKQWWANRKLKKHGLKAVSANSSEEQKKIPGDTFKA